MIYNNIVKISEQIEQGEFIKKSASKLPTLQFSALFASNFTMGKKWKYLIFF